MPYEILRFSEIKETPCRYVAIKIFESLKICYVTCTTMLAF